MQLIIAAGLIALVAPSLEIDVQFYAGDQCRGARLGGFDGLTTEDGCQDGSQFSGIAQSVFISESAQPDSVILQATFYQGENCPLGSAIATGQVGACLSVGGAFQQFDTYNAFPIAANKKREDPIQTQSDAPLDLQHGALYEDDDGVSNMIALKRFKENILALLLMGDGADMLLFKVQWRLQQIAEGAFTGVLAKDWSSAKRIANTQPLEIVPLDFSDHSISTSAAASAPVGDVMMSTSANPAYEVEAALMPFPSIQPFCTAVASCFASLGGIPSQYFPGATGFVVSAIENARMIATLENFWTFLNSPFFLATGAAYIAARYIPSSPDMPDQPAAQCSQSLFTVSAQECIDFVARSSGRGEANNVQCAFVDSNTGERGTFSVTYLPDQVLPQCGAPAPPRRLSSAPISRAERSLLGDVPSPVF